jgi:DUF971 family protein
MAGLSANIPNPIEIHLDRAARVLAVAFDDGQRFEFSCEYLRVFSPSAEVRGHGPGQEVLQTGKKNVAINAIEPVGNYAVRLVFDDGHNSGLYSWDYFYDLGQKQDANWQDYLNRLEAAGATRE